MTELPTTGSPTTLPDTIGVTRSGKLHLIDRKTVDTDGPLRAACNRTIVVDRPTMEDPLLSNLQRRTIRTARVLRRTGSVFLPSRIVCANCDSAVRRELKS
ncbi:gp38 [Rhodococcus phage ReqiPine5]|uniref:Gp38 n=1 Tax=Rhodococcus phage ReqiPine5 TaxID=691963 RepID=D4P813_9CAUD|nr:gp38 [Rhodococcus phage ReqiPine5]ADD81143.1 gp38 [Rhodococcus phage ReqiPine5]